MPPARSYSGFFVDEEGTHELFSARFSEVIESKGLFCSLYADRAGHYWHTPAAGGKVDKANPTQVGRALAQLGIELIPAYSPEARGRSERMFGTLQKRLPQELRLAGITNMAEANRFLQEVFLPEHNARFARRARGAGDGLRSLGRRRPRRYPLDPGGAVPSAMTTPCATSAMALQIPEDRHRHHYVKAKVKVHEYHDGQLAIFHGPRCLARYNPDSRQRSETSKQAA